MTHSTKKKIIEWFTDCCKADFYWNWPNYSRPLIECKKCGCSAEISVWGEGGSLADALKLNSIKE